MLALQAIFCAARSNDQTYSVIRVCFFPRSHHIMSVCSFFSVSMFLSIYVYLIFIICIVFYANA